MLWKVSEASNKVNIAIDLIWVVRSYTHESWTAKSDGSASSDDLIEGIVSAREARLAS